MLLPVFVFSAAISGADVAAAGPETAAATGSALEGSVMLLSVDFETGSWCTGACGQSQPITVINPDWLTLVESPLVATDVLHGRQYGRTSMTYYRHSRTLDWIATTHSTLDGLPVSQVWVRGQCQPADAVPVPFAG